MVCADACADSIIVIGSKVHVYSIRVLMNTKEYTLICGSELERCRGPSRKYPLPLLMCSSVIRSSKATCTLPAAPAGGGRCGGREKAAHGSLLVCGKRHRWRKWSASDT